MQAQVDLNASGRVPNAEIGPAVNRATPAGGDAIELVPIDEVARRLGLRASAIRYYEQRGLIEPVSRHSGRRWYGPAEIRRLAIVQYWQQSGLMSLDEIADILAGPSANRRWAQVVAARIEALQAQIERMQSARQFLEHILTFHPDSAPDGCAHYETMIWEPQGVDLLQNRRPLGKSS
jgi:MerR family transcriptional regulator, copper efflux regulator